MSALRWKPLGSLRNPHWELQILLDRGHLDLGEPALPLFSLLPRRHGFPQLEGVRLRLTVRHRISHGKVLASLIPSQIIWGRFEDAGEWQRGLLFAEARLVLPSGKGRVSGRLAWMIGFALHKTAPLLLWQSSLRNLADRPITLQRYAPLVVGPDTSNLPRKGLLDLFPARFHIFRLSAPPIKPSTYYNLTERFGSLRLSETTEALQSTTGTLSHWPPALQGALPEPPAIPEAPYATEGPLTWQVLQERGQAQALVALAPQRYQVRWWTQDNPYSPGLRLVYYPNESLPPGELWQAPPTLLGWSTAEHPSLAPLLKHINILD